MVHNSKSCHLYVTDELQQHIEREPPVLLCHYTNQHGLLGIISTGEIWATSVTDLNDRSEFEYAQELAESLIASRIEDESDERKKRHLGYLRNAVLKAGINICVSSWSSRIDDLSQWRAYSGAGTGYSIDVKGSALKEFAKAQDFILAACIYDKSEQERVLLSLINADLAQNIEWETAHPQTNELERFKLEQNGRSFAYHINRYASLFKHPGFAGEDEWRLVSKPIDVSRMDFRPGISTIASHFRFSLRDGSGQGNPTIRLESVHVGPCPEPERAQRNVRFLLAKYSPPLHDPEIIVSNVPYRTW
ncbi:DUF2971 domain-containing protein [Desulfosudis oleivorans]|uniref:DUF2971 domain-containing protein n=1 Tax=Desulfosudis oleivorans (strain DSM 6200 / JCM 39069 / Hxd3) TaxID=96561 RepID=A8ZWN5_DESOH|nr:DUF2971 domain-containing protein [Desulfosudis oleivorans]ABW68366.1 hypothetical protein Dole_2563 [Desulfosudis oleivorans Hxd3]